MHPTAPSKAKCQRVVLFKYLNIVSSRNLFLNLFDSSYSKLIFFVVKSFKIWIYLAHHNNECPGNKVMSPVMLKKIEMV